MARSRQCPAEIKEKQIKLMNLKLCGFCNDVCIIHYTEVAANTKGRLFNIDFFKE